VFGVVGAKVCVIRLDARRLSDEVAQWFNLAKIKKALFIENELALQTYRPVPPAFTIACWATPFPHAACSARGSGNLVLVHANASHLMSR
jgi:hypothetical protein